LIDTNDQFVLARPAAGLARNRWPTTARKQQRRNGATAANIPRLIQRHDLFTGNFLLLPAYRHGAFDKSSGQAAVSSISLTPLGREVPTWRTSPKLAVKSARK